MYLALTNGNKGYNYNIDGNDNETVVYWNDTNSNITINSRTVPPFLYNIYKKRFDDYNSFAEYIINIH